MQDPAPGARPAASLPVSQLCSASGCDEEAVLARWHQAPDQVKRELQKMDDPVAKLALVVLLIQRGSGVTQELCGTFANDAERQRCQSMNRRAHLYRTPEQVTNTTPLKARGAPGPGESLYIQVAGLPAAPWTNVAPLAAPCSGDANTCQTQAAMSAAIKGDYFAAGGLCKAQATEIAAAECSFKVAEAVAEQGVRGTYSTAFAFCLEAEPFTQPCLKHIHVRLAWGTPSAQNGRPEAWAAVNDIAGDIEQSMAPISAEVADQILDRFWSLVAERAFQQVEAVNGNALASLPARALPHWRASGAARWLALTQTPERLDEAVNGLRTRLGTTSPDVPTQSPLGPMVGAQELMYGWTEDLGIESSLPSVSYRGSARRAVAEDEQIDLAICILEAAARTRQTRMSLLRDGLRHPSPLVRWTAARLAGSLGQVAWLNEIASTEREPLVILRLQPPKRPVPPKR